MSLRQGSVTYVKSFLRAFTREKRYPTCFKFRFVSSPLLGRVFSSMSGLGVPACQIVDRQIRIDSIFGGQDGNLRVAAYSFKPYIFI